MKTAEELKAEFIHKWYSCGGIREIMESDLDQLLETVAKAQRTSDAMKAGEAVKHKGYINIAVAKNPLVTDKQEGFACDDCIYYPCAGLTEGEIEKPKRGTCGDYQPIF